MSQLRFAYFGGEPLGVPVLEELAAAGYTPSLVVANPDRPAGRKQVLTPPPVKVWAEKRGIPVYQPDIIPKEPAELPQLTEVVWDVFIVVAFNKILPTWLIELPEHQTINVHPSLLPKLRGASPIRSAILRDERDHIGVSIMQMDEKMDHGPILAQQAMPITDEHWPVAGPELDTALAHLGGALLAATLPKYMAGTISPQEQEHEAAIYCGRLTKDQAELVIDPFNLPAGEAARTAYRTIQAFAGIGDTWFMYEGVRYKIVAAHLDGERLVIDSVIPAGKTEKDFCSFFRG
jgi:methionyl-tRNA formyltransferase